MSDFLKSLTARSFGLEDGPESVRPRLPSLFEMPRTSWGVSQDEAVTETLDTAPLQNESAPGSLDPHSRATGHLAAQPEESEPVIPLVTLASEFDAKSSTFSAPDQLLTPRQSASPAINQGRYAGPEAASRTHQEPASPSTQPTRLDMDLPISERERLPEIKSASFLGFKSSITITNELKPDQKAADTQASPIFSFKSSIPTTTGLRPDQKAAHTEVFPIPGFKSFIPTTTGPELDHKFADPELFQNKSPVQNVSQPQPVEVRPMTMQPASLVADKSVFERMVMDKISLHTEVHPGIGGRSSNTHSKQKDILPLVDPQFGVKRHNLQPAINDLENKGASSRSEPEPTIQVTIGRIEIRATPPSNNIRKNTEKKPSAMGLEEYLNKRNGGAR